MRTIEYCRTGEAISDFDCEERARRFLKDASAGDSRMNVSTENFILICRVLVHEDYASHKDVCFLFEGRYILPNSEGRLPEWPNGFCTLFDDALSRILEPKTKKETP